MSVITNKQVVSFTTTHTHDGKTKTGNLLPDTESENRKRKKRCRPGEKDGKRSREKRRERQNFGHSFVKEGGALKGPLRILGNSVCAALHSHCRLYGNKPKSDFRKKKKKGNKAGKCFTLNEKQIFEQMEVSLQCCFSRCAEVPQLS